ncbi:MAG: acetolactate synthase large subunit [Magnetococcus sp. DMHC-6]
MSLSLNNRTVSDLLVSCLEAEGVSFVFGIPGEENLDFLESLRKSRIKLVVTRHEQAAAFMAATFGRLTGEAAVALSTLGPGATNLVTGVAFAQLGGMPMVVLTGQKPIKTSKQGQFQIIDVVATFAPLTKMAIQVPSGNKIPSLVREAFKRAESERPGVSHLELPEDIAREESVLHPLPKVRVRSPVAHAHALESAIRMIQAARSPLLMVASGANRGHVSQSLAAFVEKTSIPFFCTQMGKGVLDERSAQYLGTAALTQGDYLHCAVDRADLIVTVGHDVTEKPPTLMGFDNPTQVIHVNFSPAQVDDVYFPDLEVVGDISYSISWMTKHIVPSPNWDFSHFYRVREETQKHIAQGSDSDLFPILPQRFVADLRRAMPEDGILALDNGMYKIWVARNYPAYRPNTVLLDNALATMGAGLPSAIGAKIALPQRKVVAVCGDGGFMMNSQELETAVRLKLDLTVVVLNDAGYGMIKWKQAEMNLADFGLDFGNPDFVCYAQSYGAIGHRVEKTSDFLPLLTHCLHTSGVHLIDLAVDYRENKRLSQELASKVCLL